MREWDGIAASRWGQGWLSARARRRESGEAFADGLC